MLRDEHGHARNLDRELQAPLHGEALADRVTEGRIDLFRLEQEIIERPGNAHEEMFLPGIHVLVQLQDVAVMLQDKVGDRMHDAALVVAMDQQDRGIQWLAHTQTPYCAW